MNFSFIRFLGHTQRCTTVSKTSLDERSARHRDIYLTAHNTHNIQTSMPPVGFEPTISAGERPQTYALDRAATRTGNDECVTVTKSVVNYWRPIPMYEEVMRICVWSFCHFVGKAAEECEPAGWVSCRHLTPRLFLHQAMKPSACSVLKSDFGCYEYENRNFYHNKIL